MRQYLRQILNLEAEIPARTFPAPLFIAGCMRSGTSLLVDKISQHPQLLKIGTELNDIWTEIGDASCVGYCDYKDESHANSQATANMVHYFDRFVEDARSFRRWLMRLSNVIRVGSGTLSYDWDHIIPMNKSPHLTNKLRYVHALFPQSKIVLIIRSIEGHSSSMKVFFDRENKLLGRVNYIPQNPKGCYSRFEKPAVPEGVIPGRQYPGDFSIIPYMWIRLNALALTDIAHIPESSVAVICYEDLVNQQADVLSRLFDFLELREEHASKARKIISTNLKIINTSTKGDPLEKWKKYLDDTEIRQMEATIREHQGDYDFITKTLESRNILHL